MMRGGDVRVAGTRFIAREGGGGDKEVCDEMRRDNVMRGGV